jgi:hypothetical protein
MTADNGMAPDSSAVEMPAPQITFDQMRELQRFELEKAAFELERQQFEFERQRFNAEFALRQAQAVRDYECGSLSEFYAVLQSPAAGSTAPAEEPSE